MIFSVQAAGEVPAGGRNVFEELVKQHEGTILNRTEVGKRTLGYRIRKATEGYVTIYHFDLNPDKMESLGRALQLEEGIVRCMISRKPRIEPARGGKMSSPAGRSVVSGERR